MNKRILIRILVIAGFIILSVFVLKPYLSQETHQFKPKNILYFGFDLRLGPKEDTDIYGPFIEYLARKTGYTFKIKFNSKYRDTQENLGKGYVQFAALGAVSYIKAKKNYDVKILVKGLNKENKAEYQSIIFTRPESNIKDISEIKGRSFAFGSEDSTQGHLIPRKILDDAGISLNDLAKFKYTDSHKNAIESVINGEFDAGGAQDTLVKKMAEEGKIKIVKISRFYPSSGIAVSKDLDPELVELVKKALLELDPQGRHKSILPNWDKTEMPNGFVEAKDSDYSELKEMVTKYGLIE